MHLTGSPHNAPPAGMMCPLPYSWCEAGDGIVLQRVNCGDGDGIDDWVCTQPATGQRKVLLSSSNCSADYWPQADASLCPPVFNRECVAYVMRVPCACL